MTARPGPANAPGGCATDRAGAAAALEHARRFVAHLAAYSIDDWREVLQRVHAVDAAAHGAALRRAAALLAAHPDALSMDALQQAALAAAPTEAAAPVPGPARRAASPAAWPRTRPSPSRCATRSRPASSPPCTRRSLARRRWRAPAPPAAPAVAPQSRPCAPSPHP